MTLNCMNISPAILELLALTLETKQMVLILN